MDGLVIRLLDDETGAPGRWFWKSFGAVRRDFDRMYWCFTNQPWMGAPEDFCEEYCEPFEEVRQTSIQLWRPGALSRFGDRFAEEFIELWAIEPTLDNATKLAEEYSKHFYSDDFVPSHARIWLLYTDR